MRERVLRILIAVSFALLPTCPVEARAVQTPNHELQAHIDQHGHVADPEALTADEFLNRVMLMVSAARYWNGKAIYGDGTPEERKAALDAARALATVLHGRALPHLQSLPLNETSCPNEWIRGLLVADVRLVPSPESGDGGSGDEDTGSFYEVLPLFLEALEGGVLGGGSERTIDALLQTLGGVQFPDSQPAPAPIELPALRAPGILLETIEFSMEAGPRDGVRAGGERATMLEGRRAVLDALRGNAPRWTSLLREPDAVPGLDGLLKSTTTEAPPVRRLAAEVARHSLAHGLTLGTDTENAELVPFALVSDQLSGCECKPRVSIAGFGDFPGARFIEFDVHAQRLTFEVESESVSQTLRVTPTAITAIAWQ